MNLKFNHKIERKSFVDSYYTPVALDPISFLQLIVVHRHHANNKTRKKRACMQKLRAKKQRNFSPIKEGNTSYPYTV